MKTPNPSPEQSKINIYISKAPVLYRGSLKRSLAGSGSPRNAIKAKCLSCSNFQRNEVRDCTVVLCPLHPWRPYQVDMPEQGREDYDPEDDPWPTGPEIKEPK